MARKVIVVGISGTTNSGKSTLACRLANSLSQCRRVCQDHYFLSPDDPRLAPLYLPDLGHHNWEDFRALEMDRLVADVKRLVSTAQQTTGDNPAILLVEGFSIFAYRSLEVMLDKKYCITIDRDLCVKRRLTLKYYPPDVPVALYDSTVCSRYLDIAYLEFLVISRTRNYDPPDVPGYFEQVVWPAHQAHMQQIQDQHDIVYYDGNNGVEGLFKQICADLELCANRTSADT